MLNSKSSSKWNYTKIFSLFFHLPAVVWTTRWTIVKICSAIVRISSEPVEISSEPVEISSELVEISSELVSTILELLIISVFRKTFQSVSHPLIPLCHEAKGESVHFHLYSPVCWIRPCAPEAAKCFPFQSDNILSLADSQNVRSSNVLPHPNAAAPTPFCYWS